mgnify:CR=1 FL=1
MTGIGISIHALREEGDLVRWQITVKPRQFLSTPSARRATTGIYNALKGTSDFYPCPPRGGRLDLPDEFGVPGLFLSTPSARRATPAILSADPAQLYFYPRPPRGGRRDDAATVAEVDNFYPRPPRGGRRAFVFQACVFVHISIHALREEGDICGAVHFLKVRLFLSTPSARRATACPGVEIAVFEISIHALREEGDLDQLLYLLVVL